MMIDDIRNTWLRRAALVLAYPGFALAMLTFHASIVLLDATPWSCILGEQRALLDDARRIWART